MKKIVEELRKIRSEAVEAGDLTEAHKARIQELTITKGQEAVTKALRTLESEHKYTLEEVLEMAEEMILKEKLGDVLQFVNIAYIAENYFGKSRAWLHQRINGNVVNGKKAKLKPEEMVTLQNALTDISQKIGSVHII